MAMARVSHGVFPDYEHPFPYLPNSSPHPMCIVLPRHLFVQAKGVLDVSFKLQT